MNIRPKARKCSKTLLPVKFWPVGGRIMIARQFVIRTAFAVGVVILAALAFVSCDDDEPSSTPTPKETLPPTRSPGPTNAPRPLAGIDFYDWETWTFEKKSLCAGLNPEGPFLGVPQFAVSMADVPEITIPKGRTLDGVSMCKLAGLTVLSYLISPGMNIKLVAGPLEWPVRTDRSTLFVEGELVIAPSSVENPEAGATVIRATPFGLIVGHEASREDLVAAVSAIDINGIAVPAGQDIYTGDVNGIHFESEFSEASKECKYSAYGFLGAESVSASDDPRIDIEPGYLPDKAFTNDAVSYQRCDQIESSQISYLVSGSRPEMYYHIIRKSGTPEWGSISSEDWYSATSVAGLDAALLAPPAHLENEVEGGATLFVREDFGLTAIDGPDPAELFKIAEGLNR